MKQPVDTIEQAGYSK